MTTKAPGMLPSNPEPYKALAARVAELDEQRIPLPCAGSNWPTSDDREEREFVAENWCPRCPALAECMAAGETETWGVWGIDREPARKPARNGHRRAAR